ncbi:MAG: 2-C-methyl-D-erythritol 4-phosphate cytidylyltransferase [Oscillospiraceae bacterium]|nr:2-C-methyl-D-erythritol 4-phosphate cytidylyltransferase [Oscillospiraceae bacterium]
MNIALITAAGRGERIGQDIPKQFLHIENKPIIIYTLEAFEKHPSIDTILVVCLDGWHEILQAYAKQFGITKLKWIVSGGETGQESIKKGLIELSSHCSVTDSILVHDGNRALISTEIISDGLAIYKKFGNSVAVVPCTEAIFKSVDGVMSEESIPRDELFRTQTPHIYTLEKLLWAHEEAEKKNIKNTAASCALMQMLGEKTYFSAGSEKNIKITTVDDIEIFKALLSVKKDEYLK